MNRDDIIRIMREVCFEEADDVWNDGIWAVTDEELERFVARVESAEREACVELCLEHSKLNVDDASAHELGKQAGASICATAIRARGEA